MAWTITQSGVVQQLSAFMTALPGGAAAFMAVTILVFLVLGYFGLQPPSPANEIIAPVGTLLYFAFFLLMPIYSSLDKCQPEPDSPWSIDALAAASSRCIGCGSNAWAKRIISASSIVTVPVLKCRPTVMSSK